MTARSVYTFHDGGEFPRRTVYQTVRPVAAKQTDLVKPRDQFK